MHTEEGESWVRYRVDQGADKVASLRPKVVVLAPKGHDLNSGIDPGEAGETIGMKSRTTHEKARSMFPPSRVYLEVVADSVDSCDCRIREYLAPEVGDVLSESSRYFSKVHDSRFRDREPGDAFSVRLDSLDTHGIELFDPLQTVLFSPSGELA